MLVLEHMFADSRDAFDERFDAMTRSQAPAGTAYSLQLVDGPQRTSVRRGARHFVDDVEGEGYWDFFKPSDHLVVSVTDVTYRRDMAIDIDGSDYFKLRVVLSGELRDKAGRTLVRGPQAMLFTSAGYNVSSYLIAAGQRLTMIVLHTRGSMLTEVLGLDPKALPPPFNSIFDSPGASSNTRIALHPNVYHIAQRMIDSRLDIASPMRTRYLEALSEAMIMEIIQELRNREMLRSSATRWPTRELNLVLEVRDFLAQNYAKPLRIPQLARMVGINQTKLKSGFRELVGTSIYKYIQQCRMERASELLLGGGRSVAEVGYLVGYEHAANFTSAFRRHYGYLPRFWRRRNVGAQPPQVSGSQ